MILKIIKLFLRIVSVIKFKIKRVFGLLKWNFGIIHNIFVIKRNIDQRLLIIYDLSSQPYSIGDILVIQEASLIIRECYLLNEIDFAFVYNPQSPTVDVPAFSHINEENIHFYLSSIFSVAQVNPYLGSMFIFNSHSQLERFIIDNNDRYKVWPDAKTYCTKEYLYYRVFNDVIYNYFKKYNKVPYLDSRPYLLSWASSFIQEHVLPSVPITIQIRNNPINSERNLNLETWIEFFHHYENKPSIKFLIICSKSEIDNRLRDCSNVIIVKDYNTTIEQDLAIINISAIHMGASSGPGVMALFSPKPFLMINTDVDPAKYNCVNEHGNYIRFIFSNTLQNFLISPEKIELLVSEFEKMWRSIDISSYKKKEHSPLE